MSEYPPENIELPKSEKNGVQVQVCFYNDSDLPAQIYWSDFDGVLQLKRVIKSKEQWIFDTFEKHFYCAKTQYFYPYLMRGKWFHEAKESEEGRQIDLILPDPNNPYQEEKIPEPQAIVKHIENPLINKYHIFITGISGHQLFQSISISKQLLEKFPDQIQGYTENILFQNQWDNHLLELKSQLKGEFVKHQDEMIVYLGGSKNTYIGNSESFKEWAIQNFRFVDQIQRKAYQSQDQKYYVNKINNTDGRSYIKMKISLNLKVEIVKIELFDDICPITCRNFRELCEGHTRKDGHKISYTNTEFDRVVKGQFIQGGDIRKHINGHESISCSIFEQGVFNDESFALKHSEPGMLGMCKKNGLPNTNECQFYITLAPLSYMDHTNVVFGRVIEGMSAIYQIQNQDLFNERPLKKVTIESAGIYKS